MGLADDDVLVTTAKALGAALEARDLRVATAESCTGGLVAAAITAISGSAGWFDRGFVTYSNASKRAQLGVPPEIIEAHGAVSEATARAMAVGALIASDVELTVAITGVAGPTGGTDDKPVGLVYLAWAGPPGTVTSAEHHFTGDRNAIRNASALAALEGLRERAIAWPLPRPD